MAEKTKTGVAGGMFNMQDMFNKFMAMDPGEADDEGRSIKNTTMADAFSSAFQSQLSQGMAQQQAGIAKDQMQFQQKLEREAAGEARKEEFQYGMASMASQFEHQNNFANAQHDRDLGMLGATGEQERLNIKAQGQQNRLQAITEGEQSRLNIGAQGAQDRLNITAQGDQDVRKIGAQGTQDRENIKTQQAAQGARELANISAQGEADKANILTQQSAQADREVGNIQAQGAADQSNILTQQGSQGERERGNISAQGQQDRLNIGAQTTGSVWAHVSSRSIELGAAQARARPRGYSVAGGPRQCHGSC